jgi:hypothetical protein
MACFAFEVLMKRIWSSGLQRHAGQRGHSERKEPAQVVASLSSAEEDGDDNK